MEEKTPTHAVKLPKYPAASLSSGSPTHNSKRPKHFCIQISKPLLKIEDLSISYGPQPAISDLNMDIPKGRVTAFIGPSGCGKSTLLRALNRMNDLVESVHTQGRILLDNQDINQAELDVIALRQKVGMVFQQSNPFSKSIYENTIYGLRIAGINDRQTLEEKAEKSLRAAALWDEVKTRLHESALGLSGGQMQRLCIARAIAINPEIILMDEPCSALDPIATARIEELISQLKKDYTVIIVTHNMQQAARVSDYTAFLYLGKLLEYNKTRNLFTQPKCLSTENYITGRFG